MKIVVCVKHVPDATADRTFTEDGTTDRASVDSLLSELDEYAVEQALRIAESGPDVEICYLTVGPDDAKDALRKALAMGGDSAVHVADEDIEGSDVFATSLVLAEAIQRHGFDLVLCGMASTDGGAGVVPALLAEPARRPGRHPHRGTDRRGRHGDRPPRERFRDRTGPGHAAGRGVGDRPFR